MLVPDEAAPAPAVLMMHDHGAHYFIGKEKMIMPPASADSMVRADADRNSLAAFAGNIQVLQGRCPIAAVGYSWPCATQNVVYGPTSGGIG